jgi:hypothetical protein
MGCVAGRSLILGPSCDRRAHASEVGGGARSLANARSAE